MTKTDTRDVSATSAQVHALARAGCHIVRLAVPDMEAATAFAAIRATSPVPLVADIHFDHRLALAAIDSGADGLRLNPGNIRRPEHLRKVVARARERAVPIRIGVNAGSLPTDYRAGETLAARMAVLGEEQVRALEAMDFDLIKVSLKASDVLTTIEAYGLIAQRVPYPLHLGVTEAGPPATGVVRNALGIGILLHMGIGDTIRVSLSGDPVLEVDAGKEILRSLGMAPAMSNVVSCPTCGRTTLDVPGIATRVSEYLRNVDVPLTIAVMGCVVNGPGECRTADAGIAGGDEKVLVYRAGEFACSAPRDQAYEAIIGEIDSLVAARKAMTGSEDEVKKT
jgi:(E)-4-hydroxy-3-methylbut-2-enyl-diphosphate synthase